MRDSVTPKARPRPSNAAFITPVPQALVDTEDLANYPRDSFQHKHMQSKDVLDSPRSPMQWDPGIPNPNPRHHDYGNISLICAETGMALPTTPLLPGRSPSEKSALDLAGIHLGNIQHITDDLMSQHEDAENDILGVPLNLLNEARNTQQFPHRIEVTPMTDLSSSMLQYRFNSGYADHLLSIMEATAEVLNAYFQAAKSKHTFSLGNSAFYDDRPFMVLLYSEWATAFIAKRFETRLLWRLLRVHRGISLFMRCTNFAPGRGFPHISSPTLTESSVFAQDIQDILEANHQAYRGPPALPAREDKQWESQLQDTLLKTHITLVPDSRPPSRTSWTDSPAYQPTPIPVTSIARSACSSVASPALFTCTPPSSCPSSWASSYTLPTPSLCSTPWLLPGLPSPSGPGGSDRPDGPPSDDPRYRGAHGHRGQARQDSPIGPEGPMGLPGGYSAICPEGPPSPPGLPGEPGPPGPAGQTAAREWELPGPKGPYFKEEIKASDFPSFNRSPKTFDAWLEKVMPYILMVLSPWPLLAAWWNGLLQDSCTEYSENWPTLCHVICTSIMSVKWVEKEWLKFEHLYYWQRGHEEETLAEYLSRKQQHRCRILPIYPNSTPTNLHMEVAQVWNHAPPSWHAHVDHTLVETTADLIKLASNKQEQLQASSTNQIQRLICAELQWVQAGGSRRPYVMQLEDISEGGENVAVQSETPVLMAESKAKPAKDRIKSPGNYPPFSYKSIMKISSSPLQKLQKPFALQSRLSNGLPIQISKNIPMPKTAY